MARINTVILNRVNKKGLTQIQIAVTHKGKTSYIPTGKYCKPNEWKNGRVKNDADTNSYLIATENKYNAELKTIANLDSYTAIQIKDKLINSIDRFISLLEYMKQYNKSKSIGSAKVFSTFINMVCRFLQDKDHSENYQIRDINHDFILDFIDWINTTKTRRGTKYSEDSKRLNICLFKQVIKQAYDDKLISEDAKVLFKDVTIPGSIVRDNSISIDTFNLLRTYIPTGMHCTLAKDLFLLSFYLGGMNLVDILQVSFKSDVITYTRQKITERRKAYCKVTLKILPNARKIIDKYIDHNNGKLAIQQNYDVIERAFIRLFNEFKRTHTTSEYITFYSGRKLFAQIGTNIGISDTIIDYILGHSMKKRGMITHYSAIMPELAEEAMRMIFEFVDKPEDLKEIFRKNIMRQLYN